MTDGQIGPQPAPANGTKEVTIDSRAAAGLAWYFQAEMGVLAPRGWHCLALAGSGGTNLYVTPQPLPARMLDGSFKGIEGPAVQISLIVGDTSGRFTAARYIARLFPQERKFVDKVIAEKLEPAAAFPFGPYPGDKLTRHGANMVEYLTPKGTTGLGCDSWLVKGDGPITGVVILFDRDHSVLSLAVRFPRGLRGAAPEIIRQVEADNSPTVVEWPKQNVARFGLSETLRSTIREPGTYMVRWRVGRPTSPFTGSGEPMPWKLESGVVTFTVTE